MALGGALVMGGIVGFLPVVGFWMVPLGLMVLSIDSPKVRRGRRRIEIYWGRRKQRKASPSGDGVRSKEKGRD